MKLFLARDKWDRLLLFNNKPELVNGNWHSQNYDMENLDELVLYDPSPSDSDPNKGVVFEDIPWITFENSPVEFNLTLNRADISQ